MKEFNFEKTTIVDIINEILLDGKNKKVDEIIFEPNTDGLLIKMKADFGTFSHSFIPKDFARNAISRTKMMANLNIMETHREQEGIIVNDTGKYNVLITPTNDGEKVIINLK